MKKIIAIACLIGINIGCHSSPIIPDQPVKATLLGVLPVPSNGVCYALQLQIGDHRYGTDPGTFPQTIPYTVPGTVVYITYKVNTSCPEFGGDKRYLITVTSAHQ